MNMRNGIAAVILVVFCLPTVFSAQRRAVIRYDPQAPLSVLPQSEDEINAYYAIGDAPTLDRKIRSINDFLADYSGSELTHLVLRSRWQVRYEQGDPERIIESGREALEAQEYFFESKMGFIDDPSRLPELPSVRFDLVSQAATIYRSFVEVYSQLDDFEQVIENAELGLDALAEARDLLSELREDDLSVELDQMREENTQFQLFFLDTVLGGHQSADNGAGIVEYGERILEIAPNDLQTLMTISMAMAQQPPAAGEEFDRHMAQALQYAQSAVEQLEPFLAGPDSSHLTEEQKADALVQAWSTVGIAHFQLEDWGAATQAYGSALEARPARSDIYYMLGLASNNNQDLEGALSALARAVFLDPEQAQAREDLENLYRLTNGSLDGLDELIAEEGANVGG